ncbi:MAG: hypothetical protein MR528_07870 [Lachnospiraceae bacterium]|nr:hypothetical protein [Lachnospiraceae bacterium]
MAVVELIRFYGKQNDLEDMVSILSNSGDLEKIQKESGCIYFDFYYPAGSTDQLLLAEKWERNEKLELHHGTEMMANLLSLIEKYSFRLSAEKYDV